MEVISKNVYDKKLDCSDTLVACGPTLDQHRHQHERDQTKLAPEHHQRQQQQQPPQTFQQVQPPDVPQGTSPPDYAGYAHVIEHDQMLLGRQDDFCFVQVEPLWVPYVMVPITENNTMPPYPGDYTHHELPTSPDQRPVSFHTPAKSTSARNECRSGQKWKQHKNAPRQNFSHGQRKNVVADAGSTDRAIMGQKPWQEKAVAGIVETPSVNADISSASGPMKLQLQALAHEDPGCVFKVRGIKDLGFQSAEILQTYFASYGKVKEVLVPHSAGDYKRARAAGMAFVVMEDADDAEQIFAEGSKHVINSVTVVLQPFQRVARTMKEQLQTLIQEDPNTVLISRGIKELGFRSAELLQAHFASYGKVKDVLVSHSGGERKHGEHKRFRAASVGFVVMETAEDAAKIMAEGLEHVVNGIRVQLQPFQRFLGTDANQSFNIVTLFEADPQNMLADLESAVSGARSRLHSPESEYFR